VKRGKRPSYTDCEDSHRHFDQIAYWRSRFEGSNQRCQELERRNVQLERLHTSDVADDGLGLVIDSDLEQSTCTSKRKRGGSKSVRPSKRVKRTNTSATPTLLQNTVASGLDAPASTEARRTPYINQVDEVSEVSKAKEDLVVKLFVTHSLYKQEAKHEAICHSLIETTRAIGSMVSLALRNHDRLAGGNLKGLVPGESDRSELSSIVQASTRAWASLVVGLKKLSDGVEANLPTLVVVECVNMFNAVFNSISQCARQIASARSAAQSRRSIARTEAHPAPRDTAPFRSAAQFLNALISSLNKDDHHHRDIFEGVLFLLIERIGSTLFYFTFNHRRNPTIEGDIAMSRSIEYAEDYMGQDMETMAIRLEAQCLTTILERAMGLAPYHMNMPVPSRPCSATSRRPSSATRPSTTKSLPRASAVPLVAHARDRLQRTLVQSMFGEGQEDELSDVLRKPGRLGAMPKISKVEDKDVGRWYKGEVWRLLGWDIISRDSES
jgi:hypothetical protein